MIRFICVLLQYGEKYGTQTSVSINDGKREITTNALPDHDTGTFPVEGNPNTISAQNKTYSFTTTPKYTGAAEWVRQPGVAINGVKFEPGTAERVTCESGEEYRIEGIQNVYDLGLDMNQAHVQPTGAYHYHGTPKNMINNVKTEGDLIHVGFAQDGFLIYYSKSQKYKPSYRLTDEPRNGSNCNYTNPHNSMDVIIDGTKPDGTYNTDREHVKGLGDLDECNGIKIDGEYMYIITKGYPYVGRCLNGEFTPQRRGGPNGRPGGRGSGPGDGRPPPRGKSTLLLVAFLSRDLFYC